MKQYHNISKKHLEEFVSAAHRVAQQGLVVCGSGNLSWRIDDECMLITAASAWLGEMSKNDAAICRIQDGASLNGKVPSIEIGFHRAILRERQDVNVVLHFQSPYATAMACRKTQQSNNCFVIPEIPYYVGPVAVVPYMPPGSHDLAVAVTSAVRGHNLAILRNHGQVAVGKDFREAFQRAVYFEFASAVCLRAGDNVEFIGGGGKALILKNPPLIPLFQRGK
ncbi:MAG: class II aldolase/adducin family protein [bacterium]